MVNMWQAARKGLKPIELATKKEKKIKKHKHKMIENILT